jgi:hypothetical protein
MIWRFLITVAIVLTCGTACAQDFYDVGTIHKIELTFTQSNWDQILDSLYGRGFEERLVCNAVIDGIPFDSVGVRYKGNSTYSSNRIKNPLNIKLDYIKDGQEIDGYGTLKLSNVWFDPTFVREVLSYEIARKYMPASLANYTNVFVNGVKLGLYVSVEDVDKHFMSKFFHSSGNARFKGEISGPSQVYQVWGYRGPDTADYKILYELESDEGWDELVDFLDTLNNHTEAIEEVLDVDRHLWMLAFDNLLVNLDAPVNFGHNYYLYRDDSRRFNPIIWDLNMIFGGYHKIVGGSNLTVTQMQELTPLFNETNPDYPIINKVLSNPTYKKRYLAHLKTIMEENFSTGWYYTRGLQLQAIITADVQADNNKYSSNQAFLSNMTAAVQQIPGIVEIMGPRTTYLSNLPIVKAQAPGISMITHSPATIYSYQSLSVSANVTSASSVKLAYRNSLVDKFTKIDMLDDGNHGDGAAGDGRYGATVQVQATDFHYYIYAENANAAMYEPRRAEFEDSTISVISLNSSELVINEFMADNASTITDQAGEYEDWIEIYNPTGSVVSLTGLHLSDKVDNPGKWTFPDTVIAADGYIVVWADEDGGQPGLHANFKLSAGGEAVVLAATDLVIIDRFAFGAQSPDISSGRCPNGSGNFGAMSPTPGNINVCAGGTCGDVDDSGQVSITDIVRLIYYLFASGSAPNPISIADVDCNGQVSISDVVYLVHFIFAGGAQPCAACH